MTFFICRFFNRVAEVIIILLLGRPKAMQTTRSYGWLGRQGGLPGCVRKEPIEKQEVGSIQSGGISWFTLWQPSLECSYSSPNPDGVGREML